MLVEGIVELVVGSTRIDPQQAFRRCLPCYQIDAPGYGIGVRWISPMGPLRIEYGWKVNPLKGEDPGAFAFAMGQLF